MTTVNWSQPALVDLDRQHQFLATIDPELAIKAVQAIVQSGKSLEDNPKRGTPIADTPGLRKLLVPFGTHQGKRIHFLTSDNCMNRNILK